MLKRALNHFMMTTNGSRLPAAIHSMLKRALNRADSDIGNGVGGVGGNPLDAQAGIESNRRPSQQT